MDVALVVVSAAEVDGTMEKDTAGWKQARINSNLSIVFRSFTSVAQWFLA